MVAKFNRKIRRGGTIFMAALGFFFVLFSSNITKNSNGSVFGTIVHADTPEGVVGNPCDGTSCAGCCGSCGDGSAADCGGSGSSSSS
ncbi:hypothetical protein K2Q08_01300 [Patescibacteria group bacterium]|nr:hypothetical protein [Patescibacteria group bacterium]